MQIKIVQAQDVKIGDVLGHTKSGIWIPESVQCIRREEIDYDVETRKAVKKTVIVFGDGLGIIMQAEPTDFVSLLVD